LKVLVTGCAGFIGSHVTDALLAENHSVVGIDNLSNGFYANMSQAFNRKDKFTYFTADLCDGMSLRNIFMSQKHKGEPITHVCHQAALGSVPRSMEMPVEVIENNVKALNNVLEMARTFGVERVVYASSSSVYGDDPLKTKCEQSTGKALSPYALSKQMKESLADTYARVYGVKSIGLRYFNVFGHRQAHSGAYAPVVARWANLLKEGKQIEIFGTGEASRDFCYVKNVVQANLLALKAPIAPGVSAPYNIACGETTSLNKLLLMMMSVLGIDESIVRVVRRQERHGDIKSSLADISRARVQLGYRPQYSVLDGLYDLFGKPKVESNGVLLPVGSRATG